ncbi:MAG: mucoidy inhibitor MuiA family protein [Pseudomonadota bacterium]
MTPRRLCDYLTANKGPSWGIALATAGLLLALSASPIANANEPDPEPLETRADIVAVTVFPSLARVTRQLQIALPEGETDLVVTDLPAGLLPDSLRIEGHSGTGLTIGSVEVKQRFASDYVQAEEQRLRLALEGLLDQRRVLEDQVAAARMRLSFITALGQAVPERENRDISQGALNPADWQAAWSALGKGAAEAYGEIREAEIDQRALNRQIDQTQKALNQVATGQTAKLEASVRVAAADATTATLDLTYQLPGASWRPLYDARLDTQTGTLTLVQFGEVRQRSGEDWSNVKLTLSTARPSQDAQAPELTPWFLDFEAALLAQEEYLSKGSRSGDAESSLFAFEDSHAPMMESREEIPNQPASHLTADLAAAAFSARYDIPARVRVASDNAPQKFVINQRTLQADLSLRTVPKLQAKAYLTGEVVLDGGAALLPGPVAIFQDGNFIGRSHLDMVRPSETIQLSFGPDDKVKVAYRIMGGERSQEGLIDRDQRLERRFQIEVTNHHDRPYDILVLDQMPVAQDERIKVTLLSDSTPATEKDNDGRPGVLAWENTYLPNETRVIDFGYAVTFPEDLSLQGF